MTSLVPLPIVLPLLAAALTVIAGRRRNLQRAIVVSTLTAVVGVCIALLIGADDEGVVVMEAGGWAAPLGISYVVDRLAAIMLVTSSTMLLVVFVYAVGQRGVESDHVGFSPIYLVLATGVSASFVTGDMFNLFVAFEMMLAASYVLLTLGGRSDQVRAGMTYVVISLVASALFIAALALLYAATGSVNMADLSGRMAELPDGVRTGFSLLLVLVFGIKAGLFPLFLWLPDSYPTAPGPVTAIFAGLLTKVGVYAIIRTQTLLFAPEGRQGTALLIIGGLTMVAGVLGALAQDDLKRLLSFHIVGQIGYMIFGLGLFTVAGVTAVVFYIVQTILVKTNLFLVAGLIDRHTGSSRISTVGGVVRSAPVIAVFFAVPALSLAGLPPSSGFAGKFALIDAGVASREWVIVAVALVVSLLTLFSMTKVWSGVFWGEPESKPALEGRVNGGPALMVLATGVTVVLSIAYVVFAGPMYELAERAGTDLMDPVTYVDAVLGGAGR
ncbi:Na+/H+ antiporter subunit D [Ilumatobacter sp.]|uniref:Na+/H+ antiporter subunit D n=1 Tax=Ilumatobacter sp. TaxID=1967498 RepID=UPI003B52AF0A